MVEKIVVKLHVREGEYGYAGRFEFPNNKYLFKILESMPINEQKQYWFYSFNNILVSGKYSEDVKKFIRETALKLGFDIEFVMV